MASAVLLFLAAAATIPSEAPPEVYVAYFCLGAAGALYFWHHRERMGNRLTLKEALRARKQRPGSWWAPYVVALFIASATLALYLQFQVLAYEVAVVYLGTALVVDLLTPMRPMAAARPCQDDNV